MSRDSDRDLTEPRAYKASEVSVDLGAEHEKLRQRLAEAWDRNAKAWETGITFTDVPSEMPPPLPKAAWNQYAMVGAKKLADCIDASAVRVCFGREVDMPNYQDWLFWLWESLTALRHRRWKQARAYAREARHCLRIEIRRMGEL